MDLDKFFKSEKARYEFGLLHVHDESKLRDELLGISPQLYVDSAQTYLWRKKIKSQIEDIGALNALDNICRDMLDSCAKHY